MESEDAATARIAPKNAIKRDTPRYVVLAADLLIASAKQSYRMFENIELGGIWYPLRQIPCLHTFQGFITRGRITPLLQTINRAHGADQIVADKGGDGAETGEGESVKPLTGVFRPVFPYDSLTSLEAIGGKKGITPVLELEGVRWNDGTVQSIQNFILEGWGSPGFTLPTLLSEFEAMIEKRSEATSESLIKAVCGRYLESARKFRIYGNAVITRNLELAEKNRTNTSGHHQPITEQARLYAAQLGRSLDEERTIVVQSPGIAPVAAESDADREFRERQRAVELRKLEQEERDLGITPRNGGNEIESSYSLPPTGMVITEPEESIGEEHIFMVGDTVLAGGKEGVITGKPGGRITVKFEDDTKGTFEKSDIVPVKTDAT